MGTRVLSVSVSRAARRYDMIVNLVFAWFRDPRFADADAADVARSLQVEIVAETTARWQCVQPAARSSQRGASAVRPDG